MLKRKVLLAAAVLSAVSPLATMESRAQGLPTFFAILNGGNECDNTAPPAGPICNKGATRAYGSATVTIIDSATLCVGIIVHKLRNPTAVHIHEGGATVNGPIIVPISPNPVPVPDQPEGGFPGATSGCIFGLSAATIAAIRANPQNHYLNVHSAAFPGGAIRGQLF